MLPFGWPRPSGRRAAKLAPLLLTSVLLLPEVANGCASIRQELLAGYQTDRRAEAAAILEEAGVPADAIADLNNSLILELRCSD
jgi:hypothetical protein